MKKQMETKRLIREIIPCLLIAAGAVLMIFRAFYGLDLTDEAFYIAAAKRFAGGDRLFCEEWFPTQMIGILLVPLYSLYCQIHGNQEGIILFLRLCYVGFSTGIAAYLYHVLRSKDALPRKAAACAALMYLFYVRANIPTLSYYSIGLGTFLLFLLLQRGTVSRAGKFCSGISFAVSVLCMPYMVLYFGVIVIKDMGAYAGKKKKWREDIPFYAGIVCSAILFLLFCAGLGNIREVLDNLIYILQDPEHQGSIMESLTNFFSFMATVYYRYLFWPMATEFLLIGWWKVSRCGNIHVRNLLKSAAYVLFFAQALYLRTFFEGGVLIAFLLLAVQIALLNGQYESALAKRYLFPGVLFGIVWILGSNVGQRVFNMGCVAGNIWAFPVIWEDIRQSGRKIEKILKSFAPVLLVALILLIRMCDVYRDSSPACLTAVLTEGAGKGIRTTEYRKEKYEDVLKKLRTYTEEGKRLAVSGVHPWIYLEADAKCGTFSVWNVDFDDDRNSVYYETYPEQIPEIIFILNSEYEKYEAWRFSSHGSNSGGGEKDFLKGWFLELVEKEGYQKYEETCGDFYIKEDS